MHMVIQVLRRVRRRAPLTILGCFLAMIAGPAAAWAQPAVTFDTLSVRPVGPGMIYVEIEAPRVPWTLDVLEVDLTSPFLEMETATANGQLGAGYEVVSSMAARHDAPGHRVVGAINADFSGTGSRPASIQIQGGEMVRDETTYYGNPRPAVGFDVNNRVMMEVVQFSGQVKTPESTAAIHKVNESRGADELVLYNQFFGTSTGTDQSGTEISVWPLDDWIVNDTVRVEVSAVAVGQGNTPIPNGGGILSAHGTAADALNEVGAGDTLQVVINALPGQPQLQDMVAGYPYIIKNGAIDIGPRGDAVDRHPRTAVGFSADSTKLYLVTVDGRQSTSEGMTLAELSDFMLRLGVHTAMNLDGGGSTTMVVRNEIVNSPSGAERPRPNALLVVSTAPEGNLEVLQVSPNHQKLFMGESVRFSTAGTDRYYNPIELDPDSLQFSVDPPELGTITEDGLFTAGTEPDTGNVYVRYGDLVDTARVVVKTIAELSLSPRDIIADTTGAVQFEIASFDQDGLRQSVSLDRFSWSTTNPDVGIVDSTGRFHGKSEGSTHVVASYRDLADSARVTVTVQTGVRVLDGLEDEQTWSLSGENIDLDSTRVTVSTETHSQGSASLKVDYAFTYSTTELHWAYLDTDLPITGVPDSVFIDAKSSNAAKHRIYLDVEDAEGHLFRVHTLAFANSTDRFKRMPGPFATASSRTHGTMYFPIRLKRVAIKLENGADEGQRYTGTMYLDNLRVSYPVQETSAFDAEGPPISFELYPNYPNPFRTETRIVYELPRTQQVRLIVFDVLGRQVRKLVDEHQASGPKEVLFDAAELPSGMYFYRVEVGQAVKSGSMLLVR